MTVVACMAAVAAVFGTSAASAAEPDRSLVTGADAGVLASPKCSGTVSYGVIRYQVCVRYNCDSDSCYHRGYLGLINTASSARTVKWELEYSRDDFTYWYGDDSGQVVLGPGEQITIFSRRDTLDSPCGLIIQRRLTISYTSGTSDPNFVEDYMACR